MSQLLEKKLAAHLARGGLSLLMLLKEPPGTAKSELARYFTRQLSAGFVWNTQEFNGASVNVETIDRLTDFIQHTTLAPDPNAYRTILIDEADAIPPAAQTKILTLLDRIKRTRRVAVIATSNYDFEKFPERLQTRFQPFDIDGPTYPELKQFLLEKFPEAGAAASPAISIPPAPSPHPSCSPPNAATSARPSSTSTPPSWRPHNSFRSKIRYAFPLVLRAPLQTGCSKAHA